LAPALPSATVECDCSCYCYGI